MIKARAKSLFILPAAGLCAVLLLVSLALALRTGPERLAWLGAAMTALPLPATLLHLLLSRAPRASENAPLALFIAALGILLTVWEWQIERVADWPAFAVAVVCLSLLLLYVFWYSRFGRIASGKLDVGNKLPEFTLTDIDGNAAHSTDLLGKPAVLLFYRGNWCPLCMAQAAEIAARYQEFADLGISVALISPQSEAHSRSLAEKLNVPFRFWVDQGSRVAAALDIAVSHGVPAWIGGNYASDTVMPTVVVCNANGTIVFADQTDNYRLRPDIFLAILKRSGAIAQ
mgnify:CR=1 FL=1